MAEKKDFYREKNLLKGVLDVLADFKIIPKGGLQNLEPLMRKVNMTMEEEELAETVSVIDAFITKELGGLSEEVLMRINDSGVPKETKELIAQKAASEKERVKNENMTNVALFDALIKHGAMGEREIKNFEEFTNILGNSSSNHQELSEVADNMRQKIKQKLLDLEHTMIKDMLSNKGVDLEAKVGLVELVPAKFHDVFEDPAIPENIKRDIAGYFMEHGKFGKEMKNIVNESAHLGLFMSTGTDDLDMIQKAIGPQDKPLFDAAKAFARRMKESGEEGNAIYSARIAGDTALEGAKERGVKLAIENPKIGDSILEAHGFFGAKTPQQKSARESTSPGNIELLGRIHKGLEVGKTVKRVLRRV